MLENPNLHYLDNAATTMVLPQVAQAIDEALREHWANPSSLYKPGADSQQLLTAARGAVARSIGCTGKEIYFTGSGSEGNNIALLGAAMAHRAWGKRIVVSGFEHHSVQLPLRRLAGEGFEICEVRPEADGRLDVEKMLEKVNKNTALVACMLVNNETGAICDIEKLAAGVKAVSSRTTVHVDAVQGWTKMPLPLKNVDSMAVAGHKIHAPKGIGALYLRKGYEQSIVPPYLGGGQERGIRPGTENVPYAVGLGLAASLQQKDIRRRAAQIAALNARLREGLRALPGITINSPADASPSVLNFSENCVRSNTMLNFLGERQIYVSSGSACGRGERSHTLEAMGLDDRAVDTALRVSFCAGNTPEDVDALLNALEDGLRSLQHI